MFSVFSGHPEPPYFAVIFTSRLSGRDEAGYRAMIEKMNALAARQPGYLGMDDFPRADGMGVNVSYWRDEASIKAWRADAEHKVAQAAGRREWYQWFHCRIARVERSYSFERRE
jgi:heme-degrading monooxygenase HmoA